MLRAISSRFSSVLRPLSVLILVPLWMFRGIVYALRWLRYIYRTRIHPVRLLGRVVPVAVVSAVAYLIGKQILSQEPAKVVVLVICSMFAGLVVSRLYVALGLYMVLLATIFYPSAVPKPITFGGSGLGVAEILLMLILFTAYVKTYGERRHVTSPMKPGFFLLLLAILLAVAVSYREYQANPRGFYSFVDVYNYGRGLFPYALFFGILYGIRGKSELRLFFNIVLGIACTVAFLTLVQYGMGRSHSIIYGYEGDSSNLVKGLSREQEDITRIMPPGMALINLMFLTALYLAASCRKKAGLVYGALAALLAAGLALSFARNNWMGAAFGVFSAMALSPRQVKWRLAMILLVVVASGIAFTIAVSTVSPGKGGDLSAALLERVTSIFEGGELLKDPNRQEENRQAWIIVKQHPIFGVGMGGTIKQVMVKGYNQEFIPVSSAIIHNSWLDLWAHYGLCGLAAFAWLSFVFLYRAFRLWRRADEVWIRCMGLTFALYYIAWLWRCNVGMFLLSQQWEIATAAFAWGMVEIASILAIPKPESVRLREIAESGVLERSEAAAQRLQPAPVSGSDLSPRGA
jgi:O-antigen ligase